jgi:hypothetical protein
MMCTWRNAATIGEVKEAYCSAPLRKNGSYSHCLQGRLCVWRNLGMLFVDIPFAFMIVIIHIAFWRIPFFWSDIRNTIASDGAILCCIYREKTKPLDNCCVSGHRETIFCHFRYAVCDLVTLPAFLLLMCTWRNAATIGEIRMVYNDAERQVDGSSYCLQGRLACGETWACCSLTFLSPS